MPNIKSAKKRAVQSEKRRLVNSARKTSLKSSVKKVLKAIEAGESLESVKALLRDTESKFSRAKSKGTLHANTASRKVSRLAKKVSAYASAGK
ncbi:MAG: 30S ribosomal protein S20 [candidate division TM6 bacterium GW2011_GWF2_32_72]|nr:MAG: 30S ribosomal protein S20 [candidate division TM6 bacterium GW2011_GWF2_32_72]